MFLVETQVTHFADDIDILNTFLLPAQNAVKRGWALHGPLSRFAL